MTEAGSTEVHALIAQGKLGAFHWLVLLLCGACMIMDGFDVQAMGYVAPALLQAWKVDKTALGPVFGAGLFGLLLGSLAFSMVADRIGRRPVLIGSTLFFSLCMLATPLCATLGQLIAVRFVTGLGLGAIMPNAMALCGEFSPQRRRVSIMMIVSCGFTVGAVLGGLVATALIPRFGWQSVFYVGGAVPLLIGLAMIRVLPESLQFLVLAKAPREKVLAILAKAVPSVDPATIRIAAPEPHDGGIPVVRLFADGRAAGTLTIWLVSFMNLIGLYFLSNWLPTLAKSTGFPLETALLLGTTLQLGGTVGTFAMGWLIDSAGFRRILLPCFALAAGAVALIGHLAASPGLLFATVFVVGFTIIGGQPAINAMAASYYPTAIRTTGVGWCLGIGRIGSVIGPVVGGELLRLNWAQSDLFHAVALPSVLIVAALLWGARAERRDTVPVVQSRPQAAMGEP